MMFGRLSRRVSRRHACELIGEVAGVSRVRQHRDEWSRDFATGHGIPVQVLEEYTL